MAQLKDLTCQAQMPQKLPDNVQQVLIISRYNT